MSMDSLEKAMALVGAAAFLVLYVWSVWAQFTGGRRTKTEQEREDGQEGQ